MTKLTVVTTGAEVARGRRTTALLGAAVAASVVLGECENGAGSNRGSTAKGSAPFCRGQGAGGRSHDDAKWSDDGFALTGRGRGTCGEVGDSADEWARADSG